MPYEGFLFQAWTDTTPKTESSQISTWSVQTDRYTLLDLFTKISSGWDWPPEQHQI